MYGRVRSVSRAMVLAIVESGYEIAASEYDVMARSTSAGVFVCDGSMCDDVTIGTIGDATMATVDDEGDGDIRDDRLDDGGNDSGDRRHDDRAGDSDDRRRCYDGYDGRCDDSSDGVRE